MCECVRGDVGGRERGGGGEKERRREEGGREGENEEREKGGKEGWERRDYYKMHSLSPSLPTHPGGHSAVIVYERPFKPSASGISRGRSRIFYSEMYRQDHIVNEAPLPPLLHVLYCLIRYAFVCLQGFT